MASRRRVTKLLWVAGALLIVAQAIRPARANPPVDPSRTLEAAAQVPDDVAAMLDRGCRDCHTHETVWPWYSNVAPMSWIVIRHVNEGREHVNFSEWGGEDAAEQDHLLEEICDEVESGAMPLPSYLWVHGESDLTDVERQAVCSWTRTERARLQSAP